MDKIILTDGGRVAEGFTQEKLDCTVRALALTRRISYRQAYKILAQAGRKPRHKFNFSDFINNQSYAKKVHLEFGIGGFPTVRKFIIDHPEGNYIVQIRGHVFALCGGIALDLVDLTEKRFKVIRVWEIELAK
jgi:hypothetical protein